MIFHDPISCVGLFCLKREKSKSKVSSATFPHLFENVLKLYIIMQIIVDFYEHFKIKIGDCNLDMYM